MQRSCYAKHTSATVQARCEGQRKTLTVTPASCRLLYWERPRLDKEASRMPMNRQMMTSSNSLLSQNDGLDNPYIQLIAPFLCLLFCFHCERGRFLTFSHLFSRFVVSGPFCAFFSFGFVLYVGFYFLFSFILMTHTFDALFSYSSTLNSPISTGVCMTTFCSPHPFIIYTQASKKTAQSAFFLLILFVYSTLIRNSIMGG